MWPEAVGEVVAAQAEPTGERDGVLDGHLRVGRLGQELDLMGPELTERINAALGADSVRSLRCSSAPARGWS